MGEGTDFRRVFEGSPEPQLLLTGGSIVLTVTDGYLRTVGCSRAEVVGRSLLEVRPYAGRDERANLQLQNELATVWRSGLQFPHDLGGGFISSALSVPIA